jgi:hypothetical protein
VGGDSPGTMDCGFRLSMSIGDLALVEIEQLLDSLDSRRARSSLSIR